MKPVVILELFTAHLVLILSPVLTANLTVANEKYIGRNVTYPHNPCILSAFNATVTIKPANPLFTGTTYWYISPETSIASSTRCRQSLTQHYYRFKSTFNNTSQRQSLFSAGFEIGVGNAVEMHFKFIEVLCDRADGCLRDNIRYCATNDMKELEALKCLKMSASFPLIWLKVGQTYQCSHNSRATLRDVPYYNEMPDFRGTFEIDLHYVRIDASNSTKTFNAIKYCLMDWVLDTTVISIVSSIVCLTLLLIVCKCVYDCRRDAKRRKYRTKDADSLKWKKCQNDSEIEKLGQTVEL